MSARIRRLLATFVVFFLLLAGQLAYLQVFTADKLVANDNNGRTLAEERRFRRGTIFSSEGTVLAESRASQGEFAREYPLGSLFANITGYSSGRYGRSGLESAANEYLMTQKTAGSFREYFNQMAGGEPTGNDIYLTVSESLQKAAVEALGDRKGAVVALDPETGRVLAIASFPSYDPNAVESAYETLKADASAPLIDRATRGRYPPGSTFKVITAAGALEKGVAKPETLYEGPAALHVYGGKVVNYDNMELGRMRLDEAFAYSVNTVFGQVGLDLGAGLIDSAVAFGFNAEVPFILPTSSSSIPQPADKLALAWTAVGQAELEATPMQMALVSSAIANNGRLMAPTIIREVRNPEGAVVETFEPTVWKEAVSDKTAAAIKKMMVDAVAKGTGRAARIDGVQVAGKTGTAETESGRSHAWFIGFAPADKPEVAVAVIIENGGTGGKTAAPVARQVIKAALTKQASK
ncbi:MAG: peptidoglycan D,D-transpeptidase FtsI family protein [Candidatus Aquicultorales bacterium]